MAKRRKEKKQYHYECTLTGEKFTLTEKADNPDELYSVEAYYEMNPEMDDRPKDVKKKIELDKEAQEAANNAEELLGLSEE
jgi:hypothetical protein